MKALGYAGGMSETVSPTPARATKKPSSVRHSRVGHAVGRHRRLGMGDEGVEGFRRPRDAIYKRLEKRGRVLLLCLLCVEAGWLVLINAWLRLERAYLKLRLFLQV